MSFSEVHHHRMKYFLSPQLDLYQNIRKAFFNSRPERDVSVLDYGCGNGVGTIQLKHPKSPFSVLGVDHDPGVIEFAQELWGHMASFECGDYCTHDFAGEQFEPNLHDLIVCVEVIEHVVRPEDLLRAFRTELKDDGFLVVSTLNHNSQYRKNKGHIGKFTIKTFRALMEEYFPGVTIMDYTLMQELDDHSTITPMVAVWDGRRQQSYR